MCLGAQGLLQRLKIASLSLLGRGRSEIHDPPTTAIPKRYEFEKTHDSEAPLIKDPGSLGSETSDRTSHGTVRITSDRALEGLVLPSPEPGHLAKGLPANIENAQTNNSRKDFTKLFTNTSKWVTELKGNVKTWTNASKAELDQTRKENSLDPSTSDGSPISPSSISTTPGNSQASSARRRSRRRLQKRRSQHSAENPEVDSSARTDTHPRRKSTLSNNSNIAEMQSSRHPPARRVSQHLDSDLFPSSFRELASSDLVQPFTGSRSVESDATLRPSLSGELTPFDSNVLSTGSNSLDSESTLSSGSRQKKGIDSPKKVKVLFPSLTPPQPYQCTFCPLQCSGKDEWLKHERSKHFEGQEWDSTPRTPKALSKFGKVLQLRSFKWNHKDSTKVTNTCPQKEWFWDCGICHRVLKSWDERQDHIYDEHYANCETMRLWDPFVSAYPYKRDSIPFRPSSTECWDFAELNELQKPTLQERIDMIPEDAKSTKCERCNVPMESPEAVKRHCELWHTDISGWSCSRKSIRSLRDLLFHPCGDIDAPYERCKCCGEVLEFDGVEEDDFIRMEHLEQKHGFSAGSCRYTCYDDMKFSLHLAYKHNLQIEGVRDLKSLFKREPETAFSIAVAMNLAA